MDKVIRYDWVTMIKDKLANTDLLRGITPQQLDEISRLAFPCNFSTDEVVFEQDQYAEYLYILLSGEVCIRFKPYDGELINVARLGEGQVFGWSSVLGRAIYTSAAVCTSPAECAKIRGRDLQTLCQNHPDTGIIIMERLAAVIAERLSETNEQIFNLLSKNLDRKGECQRRRIDDNS
jgi:CRP-like cAMP-binding protein